MLFVEPAPAFQFYANERLAEVSELDMAERGAWVTLVMRLWREGPLPEERMQRIAGPTWKTIRFLFAIHPVPSGFSKHADCEHYSLTWLEEYRAYITQKRIVNKANGHRGGRPPKTSTSDSPTPTGEKTERLAKANQSESTYARKPEAEARSKKPEVEAGDGVQGKGEPKPMDTRVAVLIAYLTEQRKGAALDGSMRDNERACAALLAKADAASGDKAASVRTIKAIIDAGLANEFHAKNLTDFGYLFRNAAKIHAASTSKTPTNGKRSALADVINDITTA